MASISVSMPSVRYDPHQLRGLVAALGFAAQAVETDLARSSTR